MTSMIGMNPMSSGMNATGARSVMGPSATGKTKVQKMGGYRLFERPQFTPEQMQLFQSLFGQLGPESFLGKLAGGDQSQFEQLEAPALKQFNELQDNTASRFSGLGMGARRSSGFKNYLGQQTSDFAQQLQANRLGLQRQAISDLFGMSGQLLGQRPYEQFATPKSPSFLQQLTMGLFNAAGETGAAWAGGKALGK